MKVIKTETCILEMSWLQSKHDFIKLDDNFPEKEDLDDNGDPREVAREANYIRVESVYKDQMRDRIMTQEALEVAAETLSIRNDIGATPVEENLLGAQNLDD